MTWTGFLVNPVRYAVNLMFKDFTERMDRNMIPRVPRSSQGESPTNGLGYVSVAIMEFIFVCAF
jgi:hypothetical protein